MNNQQGDPGGVDLRLEGLPPQMNDGDLKQLLADLLRVGHDFTVVLGKYSEAIYWESFHNPRITNTARIAIPDYPNNVNPGRVLADGRINHFDYEGRRYIFEVRLEQTQYTTSEKFNELRNRRLRLRPPNNTARDGFLGQVRSVSCGSFNEHNEFVAAHSWASASPQRSSNFCYFGDQWPKKFHIGFPNTPGWEWMEIRERNMSGIIFASERHDEHQVVYLVVDKPPQFYSRTPSTVPRVIGSREDGYVHYRTPYPSIERHVQDHEFSVVAGVPWMFQYSRVYRIEYAPEGIELNLASFEARLSRAKRATLICLHRPQIRQSTHQIEDLSLTLQRNMKETRFLFSATGYTSCYLAVLRYFYNGLFCPYLLEARYAIEELHRIVFGTQYRGCQLCATHMDHSTENLPQIRSTCEYLKISAHGMRASHLRALRRIRANAPDNPIFPYNFSDREGRTKLGHFPLETFEVRVYPSHVEIHGPFPRAMNSVMEEYHDHVDRFLRVLFLDNDERPLRVDYGTNLDNVIASRVVQVLLNRTQLLLPHHRRFEFLGYSISSLKKRKAVWFFRTDDGGLTAHDIRSSLGKWDQASDVVQSPSKWGARIALAFTESYSMGTLDPSLLATQEDAPNLSTDGCGLISNSLSVEINKKLATIGFNKPSKAFQIRFGGVKGVVYVGSPSLLRSPSDPSQNVHLLLRNSQIKFETPQNVKPTFRIVSTASDARPSLFFAALIKTLEDSGFVDTNTIFGIYMSAYHRLTSVSSRSLYILLEICDVWDDNTGPMIQARHFPLQLALRLHERGVSPEEYRDSFLGLYLANLAERTRARDLFRIPIPGSHQVLGLTDDYGVLRARDVYIRARGQTVTGKVLIYRDPIIHVGDIQRATALSDDEVANRLGSAHLLSALTEMDNVIFFSQEGDLPFPQLLAGGDLDGDRFEILTQECGFWDDRYQPSDPSDYSNENRNQNHRVMRNFDIGEVAQFIGEYIRNDCFSELQDYFMWLADSAGEQGMNHAEVKAMGRDLSQAVDFIKSGIKVNLYEDVLNRLRIPLRDQAKPDFLRGLGKAAFYDSKGEYRPSTGLLGRIYRAVSALNYSIPERIDNACFDESH